MALGKTSFHSLNGRFVVTITDLLKRWILGTHQGAVSHEHMAYYLDEFTFRFNRRPVAESWQALLTTSLLS